MSLKIRFTSAYITGTVLAKVGNPQRDEPLETSKEVFNVAEADCETLTALFLKPFRNLIAHRFSHHSSLEQHEMNTLATAIFADPGSLLEHGCRIAKRLYSKSNHPNIKAGDLCIAMLKEVHIEGELVNGLCILKSDSVVPFLTITPRNGDLQLSTEHGINPDKIDKGCLILDHWAEKATTSSPSTAAAATPASGCANSSVLRPCQTPPSSPTPTRRWPSPSWRNKRPPMTTHRPGRPPTPPKTQRLQR